MEKERIWTKGFVGLMASNSLHGMVTHMLIPTIPLFLVSMGAAETQVGIVATAFFISSIATRLAVNVLLARAGRKAVLRGALLLVAAVMILYGFAESIGATAALRAIEGLGFGTCSTLCPAMAIDALPDTRRGEGLGYFTLGMLIAMTAAPTVAFFLIDNYGFQPLFFTASGFSLLSAASTYFIEDPIRHNAAGPGGTTACTQKARTFEWRNLFDRSLVLSAALTTLLGFCRSADMSFISIFAKEHGLGAFLTVYFIIQTTSSFCVRLVMGRVADRKGQNWVLIPGAVAVFAALTTLSLAQTGAVMLLASLFNGIGVGLLVPGMQLWMFNVVKPEKRNVAAATYFNFYDVGFSVGAIILGYIAENINYTVMFRVAAALAVAYLILYLIKGSKSAVRNAADKVQN